MAESIVSKTVKKIYLLLILLNIFIVLYWSVNLISIKSFQEAIYISSCVMIYNYVLFLIISRKRKWLKTPYVVTPVTIGILCSTLQFLFVLFFL